MLPRTTERRGAPVRLRGRLPRRGDRARAAHRLGFEALEERRLLALLGLAPYALKPDIASGGRSNVSYTQVGNNANPFHYDATPTALKLPNGTGATISAQANKTAAKAQFNVLLDNTGQLASGVAGPDLAINGRVTVNGTTYDGTLLTAEAQGFGFSDAISAASADFDSRLVITGGLLAAAGVFQNGGSLGLLIHQPGLSITKFPASFSISNSLSGSSDSATEPPKLPRLDNRMPDPPPYLPPTSNPCPSVGPVAPPGGCEVCDQIKAQANAAPTVTASADCPMSQDSAGGLVSMYDGSTAQQVTDLTIPGRGLNWSITRTYRSDVTDDGPAGQGWELNDYRRLVVVNSSNLATYQSADPGAKVGDVDQIDDNNRDALYSLNNDGSYTAPAGYYSRLVRDADGSYTERFGDGTVYSYARPDENGVATMSSLADAQGDTLRFTYNDQEQLTFLYDTYGRPIQYHYDTNGRLAEVDDYLGRKVTYTYDPGGNLASVTTPAVTGTPTGNDFPAGITTRYTYDASHRLTSITAPDEVASGGPARVMVTYDAMGRVQTVSEGGTNSSDVPAGGVIQYTYDALGSPSGPNDTATPTHQTTATDRNGNVTIYRYNQLNSVVSIDQEANRGVRSGDPAGFTSTYAYDTNYRLTQSVSPDGSTTTYGYDSSNPDRFAQGDLTSITRTPDATRGGDQSAITTTYTYEPIDNQLHTVIEPRGNDPSYVPQNGGAQSAARYTTTYTYDYQEGTNFAALGALLGIGAAAVQARLMAAGVPMGLGDVNGDGRTDQVAGRSVRTQAPTVNLLPGSNEAAVEGTTAQPIVTTYTYNDFGQVTRSVDPEGNVTTYTYYPQRDPNGDGIIDAPGGNATTGGYLKQETIDAAGAPGRDSGANPAPTSIRTTYQYDAAGNVTRAIDGRGIATDYVYNQRNEVVQITHAAAHGLIATDPAEPMTLTDFGDFERFFYDANGNVVLHQVEDRGNTSNVDGNPPAADLPSVAPNPDPAGGASYQDTIYKYDILDHRVETVQEVGGGVYLHTRYRYDPNGNQVLVIEPEGNANSAIYDERDLLYRSFRGTPDAPPLVRLAPTDPTSYDVRGGNPCQCTTYRYDGDGNVIETVDSDDTDVSSSNNDGTLGPGDRTRYTYDGFGRRTSTIDAVGDQAVNQYDPDGHVIRTSRFGPVGGASPTSDGTPGGPVSQMGVIQQGNLVNGNLLSATEASYDEMGRVIQMTRVLFVNTGPTTRAPDVAEGGSGVGLGDLNPGQTSPIPGVAGVTILGRVADRTEYDRDSRVTFTVKDDTSTTRTFYDGAGRAIETIDPAGNTVETAYDDNGNVIETRQTDVSQVPGVPSETFLTTNYYDALDRLQTTVDNLGETTSDRYDSRGNLVARADADGPSGPTITRRAYPSGPATQNTTNGFGNVTRYYYDGINRRTMQEQVLTPSGQGDGTHIGASIYGVKNDPTSPESFAPAADPAQGGGDGIIRNGYVYDADSNVTAAIDDNGNVTLWLYDDLNRKVSESQGLVVGSTLTNANIFGSRVIPTPTSATIDSPASIPTAQVNAQLAEAAARLAAIASLFPPKADRIDDTLPATKIWGLSPDDLALIYQDADQSATFTKYDAIDRPIAVRIFRNGQPDSFSGDPTFAPTNWLPSNPGGTSPATTGTNAQDFQYDGLSRMARATDNNDPSTPADDSTVTDAYDSLGRVIEESQSFGGRPAAVVSSAWRADDLRSKLTYPDGRVVDYTYDGLARVRSIEDDGAAQPIATYDYIGKDRVLQRSSPIDGTRETFLNDAGTADVGYDGMRRVVEQRDLRSDNSLIVGFTYTYDRTGHRLTQSKLHSPANSEVYGYDSAYRLISFQRPGGGLAPAQTTWTYDGVGNPTTVDGVPRQYSSTNELIADGATMLLYDANGNLVNDGAQAYTYDALGRLRTAARASDGLTIGTYSYDAKGRRIGKVVTNSGALDGATAFLLDGRQEIEERNGAGVVTQQYVYGHAIDEALVLDRNLNADSTANGAGDQRLTYHQDALGSTYALTDASGAIVEGYQYDAFGRPTVFDAGGNGAVDFGGDDAIAVGGPSQFANSTLFTGRRLDAETGLYYFRARYLDPTLDRFIQRDPVGVWQDAGNLGNGYAYVGSDPTNWVDPTGKWTWCRASCNAACWAAGGAICAAIACGCAVGSVVTVGGLAIPCTAVVIGGCAASAGASSLCGDIICEEVCGKDG